MKKISILLTGIALIALGGIWACNSKNADGKTGISELPGEISKDSLINRGAYLVTIMGCNDCHSPKKMGPHGPVIDSAFMLGGHPANLPIPDADPSATKAWMLFSPTMTAYKGPWGTTYAANISSDETGIGNWTEAQFIKCLREGKLKGMDNTRPLLPPMPWDGFGKASDDDLRAIFAYLKSTPPVNNRVPAPVPPGVLASK